MIPQTLDIVPFSNMTHKHMILYHLMTWSHKHWILYHLVTWSQKDKILYHLVTWPTSTGYCTI
jgi:hypothetical protein